MMDEIYILQNFSSFIRRKSNSPSIEGQILNQENNKFVWF